MKSIFLSPEQVFNKHIELLETVGPAAPAADLVLLTAEDDGFTIDGVSVNYFLDKGACVDRFGRDGSCDVCAVRPVLQLEEGDRAHLRRRQQDGSVVTVEYGRYPYAVLDSSMRGLAEREYKRGSLHETGRFVRVAGEKKARIPPGRKGNNLY